MYKIIKFIIVLLSPFGHSENTVMRNFSSSGVRRGLFSAFSKQKITLENTKSLSKVLYWVIKSVKYSALLLSPKVYDWYE